MSTLLKFIKTNKFWLVSLIIIMLVRWLVLSPVRIDGQSMDNTLHEGQHVLVTKLFEPDRQDIVVIDVPAKNKKYIKRVIGLPGDSLSYQDDRLYVNGDLVEEPYLDQKKLESKGKLTPDLRVATIPPGYYYVLGDNRQHSTDSRTMGLIAADKIEAKAILIYWPFNQIKWLE